MLDVNDAVDLVMSVYIQYILKMEAWNNFAKNLWYV